jgi:nucleotide-binding universal stress UspA family protein
MSQQWGSPDHRIVVGVDGSPSSKTALAWALQQAELTGASIEAVIAWHLPVAAGGIPFAPEGTMLGADFEEVARMVLTAAITEGVRPARSSSSGSQKGGKPGDRQGLAGQRETTTGGESDERDCQRRHERPGHRAEANC